MAGVVGREIRVFSHGAAVPASQKDELKSSSRANGPGREVQLESQDAPGSSDEIMADMDDLDGVKNTTEGSENMNDNYYEFTAEDYARLMARKKKPDVGFKTKAQREQERLDRRAQFKKATIRVLFPGDVIIEAQFASSETVADVRALISQCLQQPLPPFHFFTTPPRRRISLADESQDLYSAQLTPGALLHIAFEHTAADAVAAQRTGAKPERAAGGAAGGAASATEETGATSSSSSSSSSLQPSSPITVDTVLLPAILALRDKQPAGDQAGSNAVAGDGNSKGTATAADSSVAGAVLQQGTGVSRQQQKQAAKPKWFKR